MENMGQTVQVNVSSSTQSIILPCRPVHPTSISIKLLKLTPITVSLRKNLNGSTNQKKLLLKCNYNFLIL